MDGKTYMELLLYSEYGVKKFVEYYKNNYTQIGSLQLRQATSNDACRW